MQPVKSSHESMYQHSLARPFADRMNQGWKLMKAQIITASKQPLVNIGPPTKRHSNGILLVGRGWPTILYAYLD